MINNLKKYSNYVSDYNKLVAVNKLLDAFNELNKFSDKDKFEILMLALSIRNSK